MLLACKIIAIIWLTRICTIAWETQEVPDDWQRAIIVPNMEEQVVQIRLLNIQGYICFEPYRKDVYKNIRTKRQTNIRAQVKQ
uniref:Secreted protein n=1 Tax=Arion vulgaris TaxID=1028688 RepID=A0A0B7BF30_9EUPU